MTADIGIFAYVALAGMVLAAMLVLITPKPENLVLTLIMAAILFLPERANFKIPKVPALDRDTLPYLCLFVWYALRRRGLMKQARVGRGLDLAIIGSMVAAIITSRLNADPLPITKNGRIELPGLDLNDGLALAGEDLFLLGVPFILGRMLMLRARSATRLFVVFAVGGLLYSVLILLEVRLSPQLHRWIYGFTPRTGDFDQAMRWGGFRPIVFMTHPLAVALFMCNAVLAAFILSKARQRLLGLPWRPFALFLVLVLVACKSVAALIYAVVAVLLLTFCKPRTQIRVGVFLAIAAFVYPALRCNDLFPTAATVSLAKMGGPDRAQSLEFRFMNEDQILTRARQRVWFGWGGYNRDGVYNEEGRQMTVSDGYWVILFGVRGAIGAALAFLLLVLPVVTTWRRFSKIENRADQYQVAGLALMVTFSTVDLIPNGLFLNYPFFLAGALLGLTRAMTSEQRSRAASPGWAPYPMPPEMGPEWSPSAN